MTLQTWREDEFEDRGFDDWMLTASGTTSSDVEEEPYLHSRKQPYPDIIYAGSVGKLFAIELKVSPEREHNFDVWLMPLGSSGERLMISCRRVSELLNESIIVLSELSIDELSRKELWGSVSVSHASLQEDEQLPPPQLLEAVHPLTRSVYEQLNKIPVATKEAIQDVLNQFATVVSYSMTTERPPLRLAFLEDSSYLLEWTFNDRRLGFSFEVNPKDSGWYFVFSTASSERYESGTMDQLEMSRLVKMMLNP